MISCKDESEDDVESRENSQIDEMNLHNLEPRDRVLIASVLRRPVIEKMVYSDPAVIRDVDGKVAFSFFQQEKIIFAGEASFAWTERMKGRPVKGYPMLDSDIEKLRIRRR